MSALPVTLGADITSMKRSLGGAMGVISGFAKRISGAFSLKGGIVGGLPGGSTAALAAKLNAAGEAGNTANARIQSVARSMGLFGEDSPDPQGGSSDRQTRHLAILLRLIAFGKGGAPVGGAGAGWT